MEWAILDDQNSDNQAGIVHDGGLKPLLEILDSKNGSLQHNAAFALYGLADNEVTTRDRDRDRGGDMERSGGESGSESGGALC